MINRTYIVKMPTETSTTPLDILVQSAPGTQAAPVVAGTDGAYYEWRGLPLRFESLSGASNFVPRTRLGVDVSINPIAGAVVAVSGATAGIPGVQLSASFGSFASTDAGPSIAVPALADNAASPIIRLVGGAATAGKFFMVNLRINEAKDEDRSATGSA